jgi:hypothetical protein
MGRSYVDHSLLFADLREAPTTTIATSKIDNLRKKAVLHG